MTSGPSEDPIAPLRRQAGDLPTVPGVYFFKDASDRALYIGKAKSLRHRVLSYFSSDKAADPKIRAFVRQTIRIDFVVTASEVDALLMESRLIKDIQPKYNVTLKDDKTYPVLEITGGTDFPGVFVTREKTLPGSRVYGPFTDVAGLRRALQALQAVFQFRTCELDIRKDDEKRRFVRPCLLYHIDRCTAPCAARIPQARYSRDIRRLIRFLDGDRQGVLDDLQKEMDECAGRLHYERAAVIRDQIKALSNLTEYTQKGEFAHVDIEPVDPREGLKAIADMLGMKKAPRILDGVDIATLAGQDSVGSIVRFVDGIPFKSGYRRYRIRRGDGIDDYRMIREVVHRRFQRLLSEDQVMPDVFLVDGGAGHLHAACSEIDTLHIRQCRVISLAKEHEILHVPSGARIQLDDHEPASRLLRFVRDEAHRFSRHYHHHLRSKRTFH